jgi:predicted DCC family thiol-disulfide oxidoreductase YuxK
MEKAIILFDGICNLCNASVRFIIRRDPKAKFRFAPLQSSVGHKYVNAAEYQKEIPDTIILVENDKTYFGSTAVLKIVKKLNGFWRVFYVFILVPRPLRDFVYHIIARNRYRLFGQRNECMIPGIKIKNRFIE